jgi:hypothetical protein
MPKFARGKPPLPIPVGLARSPSTNLNPPSISPPPHEPSPPPKPIHQPRPLLLIPDASPSSLLLPRYRILAGVTQRQEGIAPSRLILRHRPPTSRQPLESAFPLSRIAASAARTAPKLILVSQSKHRLCLARILIRFSVGLILFA